MTAHKAGCGCCQTSDPTTLRAIHNRPSLSEIAYRSGTWHEFREAMIAALSAAPGASGAPKPLAQLRTRDPDDPTIALLDAWAVVCDVLTFYNERLAQESFVATAVDSISLQELGKLIGYRPATGVAAETRLAFTLERPSPVPVVSTDPGLAPQPVPAEIVIPVGLRVQSIPGPGERPQTFETVESVVARPEWSSMAVARTVTATPILGDTHLWLRGNGGGVRAGSAVLLTGRTPATTNFTRDQWDLRLLTDVTGMPELDLTEVALEWPLGSFDPVNSPAADPAAFALRKRFDVFGHNAPVWPSMNAEYRLGYAKSLTTEASQQQAIVADGEWYDFTATRTSGANTIVDLDGSHPDVVTGSWVVVSQEGPGFYRELFEVVSRAELSRAAFGISGTVTRLTLRGEKHDFADPRAVTVLGVSEALELTERPDASSVQGNSAIVDADATAMTPGRVVCVATTAASGEAETAVIEAVVAAGRAPDGRPRTRLTFATNLSRTFERAAAVVLGNMVTSTHGETVHEVLGDGDARRGFQRFALAQGPLTYVQAPTADGAVSTLEVTVDGTAWPQVPSHFGAGPADRTFTQRPAAEINPVTGRPFDLAQFGDGVRAARLTTGSHNVRATYRKGLGAAGNLAAHRLAQPLDRPLGIKAATNPLPATGGADPEDQTQTRRSMPVSVRTLGRAVSLEDYADFSRAFAGISVADARVLPLRSGRTIVVSVCGPGAEVAAPSTIWHLEDALAALGDPLVSVRVVPAVIGPVRLAMSVGVDPRNDPDAVREAVRTTLTAAFSPATSELAHPIAASAVIAAAAGVPGVVAVDLDRLYLVREPEPLLRDRLFARGARLASDGTPIGTEVIGFEPEPFDWLKVMT